MAIKLEHVKNYLGYAPFRPFEIRTTDGRVYHVDHPEFLFISRDRSVIYYETDDYRLVTIALSQIAALEVTNTHAA
jgi:hypothetical protein